MAQFLPFDGEEGDEVDKKVHLVHVPAARPELLKSFDIAAAIMKLRACLVLEGVGDGLSDEILGEEIIQTLHAST